MSAAMKNKLSLSHLTEEECERILQVIQRDFELRQNEKSRLTKIEEEIQEEDKKVEILGKQKNFNENCCMRCFSRFFFIFNQKVQCFRCKYFICKSCSDYVGEKKAYACKVCLKQMELEKESFDWFYNNVKKKFKRFGSAKVVRSLYKRKTDSDSENDSGYDPSLYSLSLPIGKRQRQSIQELLASDSLNDSEVFTDSAVMVQENSSYYQPQYLNGVDSSYDLGSMDEISKFKIHLNDIVNEVHQTLGARQHNTGGSTNADQYEHLLDNHRLRLCDELSHLSRSLYLSVDNQQNSDNPPSPAVKHQYIKHMLTKEVEKYVESPIDLGDETTSEYASEDGSTSELGKGYEEVLADAILKKIIADYMKYEDEYHKQEEDKVRRDLTKLSNQCTITQLQDMMSTESETDDGQSHRTSAELESDLSDIQEEEIQLESVYESQTTPNRNFQDSLKSTDSFDLDDLVSANSEQMEMQHKAFSSTPRTRQQGQDINSNDTTISTLKEMPNSTSKETTISTSKETTISTSKEKTLNDNENLRQTEAVLKESTPAIPVDRFSTYPTDNDKDKESSEFEDSYDEKSLLEFLNRRKDVALPSFSDDEEATDVDLDDISRHGNDHNGTLDSELFFGESWEVPNTNSLFGWNQISAYDNYGEKKVGKDMEGPVFMLIPHDQSMPKVGEREVTELSDGTLTDSEEENDEEAEDLNLAYVRHMVNGENLQSEVTQRRESIEVSQESRSVAEEEIIKKAMSEAMMKRALEEEPEPDPEDADPRFVSKPRSQLIQEGEVVTFICKVEGSADTDVFWYLDMAEVTQLEDDDHFEMTEGPKGTHTLTIFNTTRAHQGDYFCIAVNDNGQSHHSFKLFVKDNLGEKAAPEILKDIQDAEVVEGSTVTFRSKIKGYPTPRVVWLKDGTRLKNSASYLTEKIGNRDYSLTIRNASLFDDAEYTIVAKNICGEAKSSAQLLVEAKPQTPVSPTTPSGSRGTLSSLSDKRAEELYPGANELLKIAEEVHAKRRSVTGTAENMLTSADNLSSMHRQLDEMDRKLNYMEDEVAKETVDREFGYYGSNTSSTSSSLRESMLREHYDMKSAAEGVRKATSRALELLVDIEDSNSSVSQSPPVKKQETSPAKPPRLAQTGRSSSPEGARSPTNDLSKNKEKEALEAKKKLVEMVIDKDIELKTETDEVELNLTFQQYEKLYRLGAITREQIRKGRVPSRDMPRIMEALDQAELMSPVEEKVDPLEEIGTIDCGLKRIPSKRYKRDYIVNRSPQPQRRKWDVHPPSPLATAEVVKATPAGWKEQASLDNMEDEDASRQQSLDDVFATNAEYFDLSKPAGEIIDSVEENIYMASGKVYTLEERIKQLERSISEANDEDVEAMDKLEDEVARVVAQSVQSEHKVQDIERTVSHLEDRLQEPERDWHPRRSWQDDSFLRMTSVEKQEVVTERTSQSAAPEEGADGPRPELPSVKNLRSLFSQDLPRNPDGSVKRIYSLTGRDIPKTVREKLRKTNPSVLPGSESQPDWEASSRDAPKKRGALSSLFDDSDLRVQQTADNTQRSQGATPLSPTRSMLKSPVKKDSPVNTEQTDESNVLAIAQNWVSEDEKHSHEGATGRSPAVMARAAFWDKRITQELSVDADVQEEFPQMSSFQRRLQRQAANHIKLQLREFDHDEV